MLTMEIIPSKCFGPFTLGMPIGEALIWIQQKNKLISHVELKYYDQEPLSMDIILDLHEDGVMLRFEPKTQQLKCIEVYDVPRVRLSYSGTVFRFILIPIILVVHSPIVVLQINLLH